MNQTPNDPGDKPASDDGNRNAGGSYPDNGGTEPSKRGGAVLWLLLLVALLLLGWWWFSQRGITDEGAQPPATTDEPTAAATAEAEQAAAEAREKAQAGDAQDKPRKPSKPAAPRVTEPSPIAGRSPQPEYPRDAQRRGLSGRVLLRVDVAADGSAANVDFVTRSGTPELDRAAMNAVRKWHFAPARRNGKPIASSVNVPIDFVLPKN